ALEKQMLQDLEWIGFEWDEKPYRQSEHFDEYRNAIEKLDQVSLVYASTMTRGKIKKFVEEFEASGREWPRDPDGSPLYPGKEQEVENSGSQKIEERLGEATIRLDTRKALAQLDKSLSWQEFDQGNPSLCTEFVANIAQWGDVVLARRDTPTSYHLSCVLDDAAQNVTHIVRGSDLMQSTAVHRLLQTLFGFYEPVYHHHGLVLNEDRKKLSKSDKATGLRQLRENGATKAQILEKLGFY
ncbi:MAG: tRNA glutamyl-Q(34) synthetase GluQRS, partial [Pseudomonadota bacterium]